MKNSTNMICSMHPFCCVNNNNREESSPLPMPSPSPEFTRSACTNHNHNNWISPTNHNRHRSLTESTSSSTPANFTSSLSRPPSMRESIQLTGTVDLHLINDIVGNGISGILHKWVNYGKGWRPRWFVLQDGVLSYYKIHGPDKILLNYETEKGSKVIGEESIRRISRNKSNNGCSSSQARRKPVGEVHLKVSSIRESRSDDRRFSIFTGTKRLHLRAETREDRIAWMEALQAVKDLFPRMSNSELMAPVDDVAVSTDKLRQQLLKEGVSEAAIQDSEQIMRNEFASLQNQLMLLKEKLRMLMDTLRQLETEKVDLENTVVDETQRQCNEVGPSAGLSQDKYSASASESEDDNERVDAAEEDTDDEENAFFDTRDFLSSSSFKSSGSDFRLSSFSDDDDDLYAYASDESVDPIIRSAGTKFPYVKRRKKLPNPIEKEKGVSLWSMIKDNIGKDLTKVCLPVYFNEPLSSLQKSFEDLEYSYLLDRASEWGRRGDSLMRILNVAAFAVSAYASTEGRICKPFNPLLGETYEAEYPDKGLRFFSEKVSHHPMIIACHCEGTGWKFWGDSNLKSKFWGRSIQLDPVGILTLEFDDGEIFQWSKVTTSIYNLILGKLYCDHYGTMRIQGNRNYSCKLKFKEQSIIDRNPHQVQGIVQDRSGKTVATLFGKWDESMHYVNGDFSIGKGFDSLTEAHLLWKRSKPPKDPTRYNLTRFAITMNELIPGLKDKLPPTDSRLRPDQRCLENGEYDRANSEKLRLEERQRQARKMQERGWKPQWFAKDKGSDSYRYIGGYWEAREKDKWEACPDIFGHIPSDQM
ncbi:oxysterol-binding protein-related protein 1C-like isoform X2 [Lycium ferocissimum]|uniref:oxysterol-binding protein-related protein 1C-like isoform X2 n=1 Tax=Lycium ferocissimum TaxID=112874 RepID=UPI002815C10C|nr:oxysterol-binding protein-related protein 1C-like isoform X2 [Lycium ferocissimum]